MKVTEPVVAHEDAPAAPARYCGASKRADGVAGEPCRNRAGFKTDHAGVGRCFLHGGRNPVKHGRYSGIMRENIRGLIEQHAADDAPLDTFPELAAARALVQDYVERYDAWRDAFIAWHASYAATAPERFTPDEADALKRVLDEYEATVGGKDELSDAAAKDLDTARAIVKQILGGQGGGAGKPREVLDLADAVRMLGEVTKIAERIERVKASNAISRSDFLRVLTEMSRVVELVNDETNPAHRLEKIKHGWLGIRLG